MNLLYILCGLKACTCKGWAVWAHTSVQCAHKLQNASGPRVWADIVACLCRFHKEPHTAVCPLLPRGQLPEAVCV